MSRPPRLAAITSGTLLLMAGCPSRPATAVSDLELHRRAIVIDTHSDCTQRIAYDGIDFATAQPDMQVDLPKMRAGGLDAQFFSIFVGPWRTGPEGYYAEALKQFDAVHAMIRANPDPIAWARTAADVRANAERTRLPPRLGAAGGQALLPGGDRPAPRRGVRELRLRLSRPGLLRARAGRLGARARARPPAEGAVAHGARGDGPAAARAARATRRSHRPRRQGGGHRSRLPRERLRRGPRDAGGAGGHLQAPGPHRRATPARLRPGRRREYPRRQRAAGARGQRAAGEEPTMSGRARARRASTWSSCARTWRISTSAWRASSPRSARSRSRARWRAARSRTWAPGASPSRSSPRRARRASCASPSSWRAAGRPPGGPASSR